MISERWPILKISRVPEKTKEKVEMVKMSKRLAVCVDFDGVLEDYEDVDYSEILMDLRWTKNSLQHRLTTLRMKREVEPHDF